MPDKMTPRDALAVLAFATCEPGSVLALDALSRLRDAAEKVEALSVGCLDGGCVFKRPAGMHTNGMCRCVPQAGRKLTPQDRAGLRRRIAAMRDAIDALRAALNGETS